MTDLSREEIRRQPMRRKDRELSEEQVREIMEKSTFAVLATADKDAYPYAVPVNPLCIDGKIYFHGANFAGRKTLNMRSNPHVCLTFVPFEEVMGAEFSTDYVCAVAEGLASEITDPALKIELLKKIGRHYCSESRTEAEITQYAEAAAERIGVWEVTPEKLSGKSRSPKKFFGK